MRHVLQATMPVFGYSRSEHELFGDETDPLRELYDEYWSKCTNPSPKVLYKAMLEAGYDKQKAADCIRRWKRKAARLQLVDLDSLLGLSAKRKKNSSRQRSKRKKVSLVAQLRKQSRPTVVVPVD
jgi:hypothetical protein